MFDFRFIFFLLHILKVDLALVLISAHGYVLWNCFVEYVYRLLLKIFCPFPVQRSKAFLFIAKLKRKGRKKQGSLRSHFAKRFSDFSRKKMPLCHCCIRLLLKTKTHLTTSCSVKTRCILRHITRVSLKLLALQNKDVCNHTCVFSKKLLLLSHFLWVWVVSAS